MDSPDQGVKDIKVSSVMHVGDSLIIGVGMAAYRGVFINDTTIDGVWIQGQRFPLLLHKGELAASRRPQTPIPPFPYKSEDLTFSNKDHSIVYGATLTTPGDGKQHPALLLVTGSGQQNRDEDIKEHKPFAVIADYLTRRGYTVLRVDDRGMGKTTGSLDHVTTADFAADAGVALDFLKTRPEVDAGKIGVLGHSEGGMIAIKLAAKRKDLYFIISMAGPGEPNLQTMVDQNDAILEKQGLNAASREAYLRLYRKIIGALPDYQNKDSLIVRIEMLAAEWRKTTPQDIVLKTTGIKDESSQHNFAVAFERSINNDWFRYFIGFDPAPLIHNISCKVLALNGAKDIQVVSKGNLDGWRTALKSSHSKAYEVRELSSLNHLFQECTRCDVNEYGELEQTISPLALSTIENWLAKEVR
jgi:pimeloyl-ACP methyl ester carboxylesterase